MAIDRSRYRGHDSSNSPRYSSLFIPSELGGNRDHLDYRNQKPQDPVVAVQSYDKT